jgi:hypothetical protein
MIRLRAMYFDNKHDDYVIFIDYIYPQDEKKENLVHRDHFRELLQQGMGLYSDESGMWKIAFWDVKYVKANIISDHFHEDHKDYYLPYMNNYQHGISRNCNEVPW